MNFHHNWITRRFLSNIGTSFIMPDQSPHASLNHRLLNICIPFSDLLTVVLVAALVQYVQKGILPI